MPKKYRRYQGGGIAQLKPRPGMRQSKRSERHPLWGKHGPNPDAPIERLLRGARGVGRKVRGANRALDRHIEERWGYDPEGDAPELRRLLKLPSKIGDKVSGGIRKLLLGNTRMRRTRPPEGGYQEDFYELKNILDKAPGSEMEWEIPGRPGRGPLRIPRPFDPQMLRLGRGRELQEERNRRTGRATKEQLKRRMLESLLESPMKMEYMPPRQFGAGRRSPRRYHSGGNIPKHEHGKGPRQHLVTNLNPSQDEGSDWSSYPVHYRMAGMSAGDTLHVSPEGVEGYLAPEAQALRDLDMGRIERENTRFQLAEEERRNEGLDPFDIMDREVAAYDSLRAGTLGRETVGVPLPNSPEWEAMREAQEAYIRRRRLGPMGDPTIGRAFGGLIGLQTGGPAPTGQYSGYGGPGQMQVRQETLHPGVAQQYGQLTGAIMQAGAQPLQQFGPGVAGMTQMEAAAQAGIGAYGRGAGPQGTLQAASTLGQAAQGIGSMIPQQQALAASYGAMAPQAYQQAQAGATGMQQLGARAQLQGQLAGAQMRTTGGTAQTEQQAMGLGQATAGTVAQAQQQQLGAEQERRGAVAQTQMQGLGQQAQQAGQAALGAQQGFGTGITGMGTAAQTAGTTAQTAMGLTGTEAQTQAKSAAERMRILGKQAPDLQKGADLSQYMSQYTQGVTDPQLQQLMEFQKMQGQELGSQAAGAGAFGGLRQGVQAATQAQQASQQAADIIGKGQQEAFQSAQQAFQADRAAKQQAQQTGLSAEQQAAATQAGAQGQALAAQQAGIGAVQAGGAQQMQAQQQAAGMADVGVGRQLQGLQAQAGTTAQGIGMGQQGLEAQRAAEQVGAGQQAQALAAQRAAATQGAQLGMQGQQQGFGMAQQGTQLGLSALQGAQAAGQQGFGTAANLMQGQMGAMGAQMGAYGQLAGIGGQQATLGGQQQQQQMARLRMMEQAGGRQRQLGQAGLDYQRAQFEQRQQYPQQQIGWMNQQLGALPYQSTVTQGTYAQQPGTVQSLMGAGLQGLGLYNAYQNRGTQGAPTP